MDFRNICLYWTFDKIYLFFCFVFCSCQGETPVNMATRKGMFEVVELLLTHGADNSKKDKVGIYETICAATSNWYWRKLNLLLLKSEYKWLMNKEEKEKSDYFNNYFYWGCKSRNK